MAALLGACGAPHSEQVEVRVETAADERKCLPGPVAFPHDSPDFILMELVPGYGGLYFDETGRVVVMLTDPAQRPCVERVVHRHLPGLLRRVPDGASPPILFRDAEFDLLTLNEWRFRVIPQMSSAAPPNLLAIDHRANRIVFGVEDEVAKEIARQMLEEGGVPLGAIQFEITSGLILDAS